MKWLNGNAFLVLLLVLLALGIAGYLMKNVVVLLLLFVVVVALIIAKVLTRPR